MNLIINAKNAMTKGGKLVFDVPIDRIFGVNTEMRKISELDSKKEKMLDVAYRFNSAKTIASFSGGGQIDEWVEALNRIVSGKISEEIETCPQCGKPAPAKELLEEGCQSCSWVSPVSPRLKQRTENRKNNIITSDFYFLSSDFCLH